MKKQLQKIGMYFLLSALTVIITVSVTTISGCKKEKVKGCTNKNADNYKSDAEEDDGTCSYSGNVVLWFNTTTRDNLTAAGITSLTFYVDGSIVGSCTVASAGWTGAPNCGQTASITVSKSWKDASTKSYSLDVIDDLATHHWTGTQQFTAKTCSTQELLY